MKDLSRILWGIVLVLLGIIWGLNATGVTNIDIFFDGWWTLFIIVPAFVNLLDPKKTGKWGSTLWLIAGVFLLLACRDIIDLDLVWKLAVPIIIVLIGLSLIFKNPDKEGIKENIEKLNDKKCEYLTVSFKEQKISKSGAFKGANLDAVFGSLKLDLTDAKLGKETIIKASSIFAGINIIVPEDVEVKIKSTPIFGGVSNTHKNNNSKKIIYIDAVCVFGGIEIQ